MEHMERVDVSRQAVQWTASTVSTISSSSEGGDVSSRGGGVSLGEGGDTFSGRGDASSGEVVQSPEQGERGKEKSWSLCLSAALPRG